MSAKRRDIGPGELGIVPRREEIHNSWNGGVTRSV